MSNEDEEFDRLRQEMSELHQRFDVPAEKLTGCQGADATKSVTVTLNSRGLVTMVSVDTAWRDKVRPHQLGAAVLQAIDGAGQNLLARWATAIAEGPGKAVRPEPAAATTPTATVQGILGLLERLDDELDGITDGIVTVATRKTTGVGRHVTATLTGKQISGVDIDQEWLRSANSQDITNEIRAAIRAAYDTARQAAGETLANSPATQLQALTSDPAGLLRQLGMS